MMPPTSMPTSSSPACTHQVEHARHQRHVGAAQEAQAQPIGVFIGHGPHDGLGRLPQPRVDHMKAMIAQPARHDFDAAIVAVEADLGENDPRRRGVIHRLALAPPGESLTRSSAHTGRKRPRGRS